MKSTGKVFTLMRTSLSSPSVYPLTTNGIYTIPYLRREKPWDMYYMLTPGQLR
ncbi:MAG: hypothetical protein LBQ00_01995 [Syntrophobacterales bacterium]|jgi:hypothetical protein|nr:hypothetical protein [Syntrophobacterales bacterium]